MLGLKLAGLVALVGGAVAQLRENEPWPFDVTTISAPDGSVTAKFVSFGATMVELWLKDSSGQSLDVIPSYDDPSQLLDDPAHPVFNAIVGRYANRIKNGTFSIPPTRDPPANGTNVYHIPTNDHDGQDTLHGGIYGWDRRNWTLVAKNETSVTYHHLDAADEGFPGNVSVYVTHTVANGQLRSQAHATATQKTPIMLTQHVYWNLDGFRTNTSNWNTSNVLDYTLHVESARYLETDSNGVPTGPILEVYDTPLDFRTPTKIGARWDQAVDVCGPGCQGYDNCWIYDQPLGEKPGVSLWSSWSGIKVDITSDTPATQVYTANYLSTPRKAVHGGPTLTYNPHSAVAIEQEGWIAAINNPEWGIDQIYEPGKDFSWSVTYRFSNVY
ncbi:hypothetical protein EVG20_g8563 [Dentipellis fragilis]|uniref:Aldose 1-epimerase n=1 Tax=Dentipellis fragilis TaxID=205917 RepID=A0A4Y9Y763_9AGAM|nr:hypothetical protein EVG20_g8563 [Dentipellis fragilis]